MKKTCFAFLALTISSPVLAQDTGLVECDAFLKHYAQCIEKGASADNKKMLQDAVSNMRKQFLELKSQAPAETLQTICKDHQTSMKDTFEALKCRPM
jgi:hypothetical protein